MSDPLSALITGAATLGGGLVQGVSNIIGGNEAAKVQRETNAMTVDLANTAHQREMADLKKAGINPLMTIRGSGASTPTLNAPVQSAEGLSKAGRDAGNAIAILPAQVLSFMTGQQQIEILREQKEKIEAETKLVTENTKWVTPKANMQISQAAQNIVESTQRTTESKARTATIEAMRNPQIQQIVTHAALQSQQIKTEEQRTKELTEAAKVAQQLYGARAKEASTLAAQAATYYKDFFLREHTTKLEELDIQIKLLKSREFQQVIQNILDNEYGRYERWSKIMQNPAAQLGLQMAEMIHKKQLGNVSQRKE